MAILAVRARVLVNEQHPAASEESARCAHRLELRRRPQMMERETDPDHVDRLSIATATDAVMSLDDQLAQLWAAGATLSQIERSAGVSRGVAIGRIHRARKAGDVRFQPRSPNPKAPVKARRLKPFGETIGNRVPPPPPPKPPEPR